MSYIRSALQAASDVIRTEKITRLPVDVRKIARKHAHIIDRELEDDLSGMLVPLPHPVRGKQWIIVVNRRHPEVRRRFTIAHELGHLLLHGYTAPHADTKFRIRLRATSSSSNQDMEETQANRFAAALLMPENLLVPRLDLETLEYVPGEQHTDESLERLARIFVVSKEALTIRLAHLLA